MENKISTSQFLLISVVLSVTYKLNNFATIIYNGYKSSTILVVIMYLLVDILTSIAVYKLAKNDFWGSLNGKRRVIMSVALTLFFVLKMLVYFSEQASFVKTYLMGEMPSWLIYIILLLPTIAFSRYMFNSLARTNELLLPIISLLLLLNLVFLRVEMKFDYNLPLLSEYTKGYNGVFSYFVWSFDSLPLIMTKIEDKREKKRRKFVGTLGYSIGILFTIMIVVFGISIYGGAFSKVDNLYVKISIFNDYNMIFGRLDWIGIICWLTCSFITNSALVIALKCSTQVMTKTRRNVSIIPLFITYFLLVFYLKDVQVVEKLAVDYFGFIMFYLFMIVMFLILFMKIWGQNGKKDTEK